MKLQTLWEIVKEAGLEWVDDKAPRLGAALSYYTIFSIAPLLVIVIGLAGAIFGTQAAESGVVQQIENLVGQQGADAVRSMLRGAGQSGNGVLGSILGFAMLLFGAGGLFIQLQDALNTVWEVQPKPNRGLSGVVRDRFLSLAMILGIAFLLLVSLVVSAGLTAMGSLLGDWQTSIVGHLIALVVDLGVITLLFAMIYRFLPDAHIAWSDVWFGAGVTAILFVLGKFLIGLYLGHSSVGSSYGAAGSLAVLLVWIYYAAQIFLFGAELTKAYANRLGSKIVPTSNAEPVTAEARAQQGIPKHRTANGHDVQPPAVTRTSG